jgi:hypothetical protein
LLRDGGGNSHGKTPPLTAQERVILFCTATGVSHASKQEKSGKQK